MGHIRHGCAKTTEAVRRAIQNSQERLNKLAKREAINPKTVAKGKKRSSIQDAPRGPKQARSSLLTSEQEAICIAFRKHTRLPLEDCLYALQTSLPNLTRSSLHRLFHRPEISRWPEGEGIKKPKKKFKAYPIGYFHIDIAEGLTQEGK